MLSNTRNNFGQFFASALTLPKCIESQKEFSRHITIIELIFTTDMSKVRCLSAGCFYFDCIRCNVEIVCFVVAAGPMGYSRFSHCFQAFFKEEQLAIESLLTLSLMF